MREEGRRQGVMGHRGGMPLSLSQPIRTGSVAWAIVPSRGR